MATAAILIDIATWWTYAGLASAAVFLLFGLERIDESARTTFLFRVLLVPGLVLLWPLVLWRWWRIETGADAHVQVPPRRAHGRVWLVLSVLIPAIFFGAIWLAQPPESDLSPVKLSEVSQ